MNRCPSIAILGNIAAGKTTLARGLAHELGLPALLEDPTSNPFLPRMAEAPSRWCLANQIWFLAEAAQSCSAAQTSGGVLDHSIEEVSPIHSEVFAAQGWLDAEELELLERARIGCFSSDAVDLFVVVDVEPATSIERVRQRGRGADRLPEAGYLHAVAQRRERFLARTSTPLLRVSSDLSDFRDPAEAARIAGQLSPLLG